MQIDHSRHANQFVYLAKYVFWHISIQLI